MRVNVQPSEILYSSLDDELLGIVQNEEDEGLSDKPWKDSRKRKSKKRTRYSGDDWEEQQQARKRYLKEWEEEMRYAEELANEGM